MTTDLALACFAVTALCFGGFFSRPRSLFELLSPRFVIPATTFSTTVLNALFHEKTSLQVVILAYKTYAAEAMWFVAACLLVFWVGYWLPIGSQIGKRAPVMPFDIKKYAGFGFFGSLSLIAFQFAGPPLIEILGPTAKIVSIVLSVAPFGIGVLLGCYLGSRAKLTLFHWLFATALLFVGMLPLMDRFSRGTGIPIFIMVFSCCFVRKRFRVLPLTLALLATLYLGQQGLQGRSVAGHFAGAASYWSYILENPIPNDIAKSGFTLVHDSITPTAVAVMAREQPASHTGTLSTSQWALNLAPVPRALGLGTYDFNLGNYIAGGVVTWGYTPSIFGDLVHHHGFIGCLFFLPVGIFYRLVETCTFRGEKAPWIKTEWYVLLCLISYFAYLMGMYLTYRSWLVSSCLGMYAFLALMALRIVFGGATSPMPAARFTPVRPGSAGLSDRYTHK